MKTKLTPTPSNITRRQALALLTAAVPLASMSLSPTALAQAGAQARKAPSKDQAKSAPALTALAAVNISGRQRSLVLRAARAYAQLGLGITPQASSTVVRTAVTEFDAAMVLLRPYVTNTNSASNANQQVLNEIASQWSEFTPLLREAPSQSATMQKNAALEKLISACSTLHDQIVRAQTGNRAVMVSRSGRQRFLSQRAAQLFMYREWGVARGDYKDIEQLSAEYKTVKRDLSANARIELKRELDLAETQWIFFEDALRAQQKGKADDIARRNVSTTSERLLEMFDGITNQFVRTAA
jgi:hypothetical protein